MFRWNSVCFETGFETELLDGFNGFWTLLTPELLKFLAPFPLFPLADDGGVFPPKLLFIPLPDPELPPFVLL